MKIFLIGMPGSGKSTVGKLLAKRMELPFVDLDTEIETREGKPVKEIFSTNGEDYFRRAESSALKALASSDKNFVMATGGGAPCFHDGITVINKAGLTIFLDTPIDVIVTRVEKDTNRPLLLTENASDLKKKLQGIREHRLQYYQQAKISVPESEVETVLTNIKMLLQQ